MEKEKQEKLIEGVTNLFKSVQLDLKKDCDEGSVVVGVSFDCQRFGLKYPVQFVLCDNRLTYTRIISPEGCSKFECNNKPEVK